MLGIKILVKKSITSLFVDLKEDSDDPRDKKLKSLNAKLKQEKYT